MSLKKLTPFFTLLLCLAIFAVCGSGAEISLYPQAKYKYTMYVEATAQFNSVEMKDRDAVILSMFSGSSTSVVCKDGASRRITVSNAFFNGVPATSSQLAFSTSDAASPAASYMSKFTWSGEICFEDCYTDPAEFIGLSALSLPLTAQLPAYDNANLSFKVTSVTVKAEAVSESIGTEIFLEDFNNGRGLKVSQKNAVINSTGSFTVIASLKNPVQDATYSLLTDITLQPIFAQGTSGSKTLTFTVPKNYIYDEEYGIFFDKLTVCGDDGTALPLESIRLQFTEKTTSSKNTVSLNCDKITLNTGVSFNLTANKSVSFKSSDTNIAQVDSNGTVTAKNTGTAVITAYYGDVKASCTVTVIASEKPSLTVLLPYKECIARVGKSYTLHALLDDGATDKVFWYSSDSSVAAIDPESGKLIAYKPGTVTLTAHSSSGKTASCTLTVKLPD